MGPAKDPPGDSQAMGTNRSRRDTFRPTAGPGISCPSPGPHRPFPGNFSQPPRPHHPRSPSGHPDTPNPCPTNRKSSLGSPVPHHLNTTPTLASCSHLSVPPHRTPKLTLQWAPSHASPRSLSVPRPFTGPSLSPCPSALPSPQCPLRYLCPLPPTAPIPRCSPHAGDTALQPLPLPAVPSLTAGRGVPRRAGPGGGREAAEAADGSHCRRHLRRGRMRERPPGA